MHIIVKAALPTGDGARRRNGRVEMYDADRFFTVTGQPLPGAPTGIEARQAELTALYARTFGPSDETRERASANGREVGGLGDEEVIARARAARNGAKFARLFDAGDTGDYGGDDSAADQALCSLLSFWTPDPAQIDRLFRQSALYRPKWERADYRRRTIAKALGRTEAYAPAHPGGPSPNGRQDPAGRDGAPWGDGGLGGSRAGGDGAPGVLLRDVAPEALRWLSRGRLAAGKLTVADGDPGVGKSTILLGWAAGVSRGEALPDGEAGEPRGVVLLSAEDGVADTIRPRAEAAGADLSRVLVLNEIADPATAAPRTLAIPDDLPAVEAAVRRVDAALVVVDPLMAFLGGQLNSWSDHAVRRALAPLAAMAERTGAALVAVRHLTTQAGGHPLYRGGGSIGIIGAARFGLLFAPDPDDDARRLVASTKTNLSRPPATLAYRLEPAPGTDVARAVPEGPSRLTAADLLAAAATDADATEEATAFLLGLLGDGPVPAKEVHGAARQAGISKPAVERAKKALGIRPRKHGFGTAGAWSWELPPLYPPA